MEAMHLIGAENINRFDGLSNEQIVGQIREGRHDLFEVIMRRHNQRLFRITKGILKEDDEAEDVMQDAYVKAFSKLDQFEGRASFSTWLTKIAVYEALARARKRGRFVDMGEEQEMGMRSNNDSGDRGPEDKASIAELSKVLEASINGLPESQRVVVMMREVEGFSTAETAELLEISEEAVKVRLHRGRQALRLDIDEKMDEATRTAFLYLAPRCNRMVRRVFAALGIAVADESADSCDH